MCHINPCHINFLSFQGWVQDGILLLLTPEKSLTLSSQDNCKYDMKRARYLVLEAHQIIQMQLLTLTISQINQVNSLNCIIWIKIYCNLINQVHRSFQNCKLSCRNEKKNISGRDLKQSELPEGN